MEIDLYEELAQIINDYNINLVCPTKQGFVMENDWERVMWKELYEELANNGIHKVALYGGGHWGRYTYNGLKGCQELNIECIIDNYVKWEDEPVETYTFYEWLNRSDELRTECVLLTNINNVDDFKSQLFCEGYDGLIIDVLEWIRNNYDSIEPNELEVAENMRYSTYPKINKYIERYDKYHYYSDLRKIIYNLFLIKDFYSAERYVKMVIDYSKEDYYMYLEALEKVKKLLEQAVEEIDNSTTVVNIVDSLSIEYIDRMPYLKEYVSQNFCLSGLSNDYSTTKFAIKTLFSGQSAFTQVLEKRKINKENSCILKCAHETERPVYYVSCIEDDIDKKYNFQAGSITSIYRETLSEILFEGLHLATGNKKIVFLHSFLEVHEPYFCIGGMSKSYPHKLSWTDHRDNYDRCFKYVNYTLQWYYHFYDKANISMVTMGDHGGHVECDYEMFYCQGKKDLSYCTFERLSPLFVVKTENIGAYKFEGLIPRTRLPEIFKLILCNELKNNIEKIEEMADSWIEVQSIPMYHPYSIEKYMKNNVWGAYEGAIGLRTKDEIYLKYISGREIYYRKDAHSYRNLIHDKKYRDTINKCRKLLDEKEFPVEMYGLEQHKHHMERLKEYNLEEYEFIKSKLQERNIV